jgi:cupin superfamily acireductone dioxygenase involved in methionine salvage
MPKKKSIKKAVERFRRQRDEILGFLDEVDKSELSKKNVSWCYEQALIRLYRAFENLMLDCIVAAVNNDTSTLSAKTGFEFPKHLTDEVCEYIIVGGGYFDFKGRDGLISTLRKYLPDNHYLVELIKRKRFKEPLDLMVALRNYATHDSPKSKTAAKKATGNSRIGSAGSFLKSNAGNRLGDIIYEIDYLTSLIEGAAPY